MIKYQILPRPDWWGVGLPLPHIVAGVNYSGKGRIGEGGKVVTTVIPVRWETLSEWRERTGRA